MKKKGTTAVDWGKTVAILLSALALILAGITTALSADNIDNPYGEYPASKYSELIVREGDNTGLPDAAELGLSPEAYMAREAAGVLTGEKEEKLTSAIPVTILADGAEKKIYTVQDTVREALALASVSLEGADKLNGCTMDTKLTADMKINVVRVDTDYEYVRTPIAFRTEERSNNTMDKGMVKVVREGSNGEMLSTYKLVRENGVVVSRELVKNENVTAAISKLVDVGTVPVYMTSRGEKIRYSKVIECKATAYTSCYADTGKSQGDPYFGITYSGAKARVGIVAVDPSVIPLGTRLYIEGIGFSDYGYCVAGDIGSAVKGNMVDLYFNTWAESSAFGVKYCKVYIIK